MKRNSSSVSSQIQLLVDRATNASLASADPSLSASIVQFAKSSDDAPKEVARALRKRLSAVSSARDFRAADHCLDLLEACVQSCGARFHTQLAGKRDLLDELVRLIGPKHSPPPELQDRVLHLLLSWSDSFSDRPDLREVDRVLKELRSKGVQFPDPSSTYESLQTYSNAGQNSGATAAAATSAASAAANPASHQPRQAPQLPQTQRPSQSQPGQLTPHQLGKLRSDVDQVCANCKIFNELLTETAAGTAQDEDVQLMRQLNAVNRQMQQRVMELLGQISNETVLIELLRVNDELNSAFLRFDRYENSRPPPTSQQQQQQQQGSMYPSLSTGAAAAESPNPHQAPSPMYPSVGSATAAVNLIDLSDEAQPPSPPPRGVAAANNPGNLPDSEAELAEMESWMRKEGLTTAADTAAADKNSTQIGTDRFQL